MLTVTSKVTVNITWLRGRKSAGRFFVFRQLPAKQKRVAGLRKAPSAAEQSKQLRFLRFNPLHPLYHRV